MAPRRSALLRAACSLAIAGALSLPAGADGADGAAAPHALVSITQTSTRLAQQLTRLPGLRFSPTARRRGLPLVRVDDRVGYQTFLGAGAAMTDSSAWLLENHLSAATRTALMARIFGAGGIHLSFLRIGVGSTDFDVGGAPYTYDDQPAGRTDPTLSDFSIAHDDAYILPALRQARALNRRLYLEASPWSPPAWMKANDALDNKHSAGTLKPADEGVYAKYLVRFLRAYAAAGVPVSALAIQNEPTEYTIGPGLQLSESAEVTLARRYVKPALTAAGLHQSLFGWDLSWGPLTGSDPTVRATEHHGVLGGLGWHCYFGSPEDMDRVHRVSPASVQIVDECGTDVNDPWSTGEVLIASLRHWANGIAFWNLALDPNGGPVVQPNIGCLGCTGLITVNPANGTYALNGDYYSLGQLTRFVSPGARRVASNTFASLHLDSDYQTVARGLDDVALRNRNGSIVLLTHNNATHATRFQIEYRDAYLTDTLPAGATTTFVWPGARRG